MRQRGYGPSITLLYDEKEMELSIFFHESAFCVFTKWWPAALMAFTPKFEEVAERTRLKAGKMKESLCADL